MCTCSHVVRLQPLLERFSERLLTGSGLVWSGDGATVHDAVPSLWVWSGDGAAVHDAVPSLWVWSGLVTGQQFMTRFHICGFGLIW